MTQKIAPLPAQVVDPGVLDVLTVLPQHGHGLAQIVCFDEQVVGIECRDRENADSRLSQRGDQHGENADGRERNRARYAQAPPISFAADPVRHKRLQANDRKLILGARDREQGT